MTTQTNQNAGAAISARTETMQDFLMLASFSLWALLIGLAPVLSFHFLMAS
jgi:hypothetical protein